MTETIQKSKEPEAPDQQADKPQQADKAPEKEKAPMSTGLRVMLLVVAVLLVLGGVLWWLHSQTYVDTDDAQIDGHLNAVASRVDGSVKAIYFEDNQVVNKGQPLIDLDPADAEAKLLQAEAEYDQAVAQLGAQHPNLPITKQSNATDAASIRSEVAADEAAVAGAQFDYDKSVAQLRQAEATNVKNQSDLVRYKELLDKEELARSDYDQYLASARSQQATVEADRASVDSAAKSVDQRRAQVAEQRAKLEQSLHNAPLQLAIKTATIKSQAASVESAKAQLEQNRLNLSYCKILSPVKGIVTERSAELGGRISAGQQLLLVVQTDDLWVTANFKETQIKRIAINQPAQIKVDALDKTFEAYVQSMPAATGDRTSVLPPENATGNYVKVVQRLPLRIRFKAGQSGLERLRPGMSVTAKVLFQ